MVNDLPRDLQLFYRMLAVDPKLKDFGILVYNSLSSTTQKDATVTEFRDKCTFRRITHYILIPLYFTMVSLNLKLCVRWLAHLPT